jgi:hypothetical protein
MNKRYDDPSSYLNNRALEFAILSYEYKTSILTVLRTTEEKDYKITKEEKILGKYITEEKIVNEYLKDLYKIDIKNIDKEKMAKDGLESLLEYTKEYGFLNQKIFMNSPSELINPFIKILTENHKSYIMSILSTQSISLLLAIYYHILSCRMNEKCKNYYPTPNGIKELIDIKYTYSKILERYGLIEKVLYSRPKYILKPYGEEIAEWLAIQAYIASHL